MHNQERRKRLPDGEAGCAATAWISSGFETLCYEIARKAAREPVDYDVIIVGSGYGGAIAASEIAGCALPDESGKPRPVSVCILERGREYLPGSFPSRFSELPGHVRVSSAQSAQPAGPREGLFDVRAGADVTAIVANGLGGGSLINAGVMAEPIDGVFGADWPEPIRQDPELRSFYDLARRKLGAADDNGSNTIGRHAEGPPQKHFALRRLAKGHAKADAFRMADITVTMRPMENQAGVLLNECKRCGDCATGCNHGAKNSLDANLLVTAFRRGAEIYTGATVLRIEKLTLSEREAWSLEVVHTDEKLRRKQRVPLKLTARRLILAAGTFGSTEILLRSRNDNLQLSNMLGQRFSTNGDMIAAGHGHTEYVESVADEAVPAEQRHIGPTITGMIDLRREHGVLIQEMAVPGPLRRIFEEAVTTSAALHGLAQASKRGRDAHSCDPHAIDADAIARTAIYAVMGDDRAEGRLELVPGDGYEDDGAIRVHWPGLRDQGLFAEQIERLRALAQGSDMKGHILPNPLWKLLPSEMETILDIDKGPPLTVHPLGGCATGNDCAGGVVDDCGRVYDRVTQKPFEGLVVLDGSIIPTALGVNPALTIAALSLRAVGKLREDWGMRPAATEPPSVAGARPVFKQPEAPAGAVDTEVQVLERMVGRVMMQGADGAVQPRIVELTLRFSPIAVADLTAPGGGVLHVDESVTIEAPPSLIRIFDPDKWTAMVRGTAAGMPAQGIVWTDPATPDKLVKGPVTEEMLDREAELSAALSGTLTAFVPEDSGYLAGTWRTLWAWFRNRGLRDALQNLTERVMSLARGETLVPSGGKKTGLLDLVRNTWALASHARHARRLEYKLTIGAPAKAAGQPFYAARLREGAVLSGHKRLAYSHRANPWRQLQEMTLDAFPGMPRGSRAVLKLDTRFLANQQWPLLRIVRQQDQPTALADLASLGLYVMRMMATIHTWSFRKPDALAHRKPQRLPGKLPGMPPPEVHEIEVDRLPDATPVHVRMTRYRGKDTRLPPIVMIHGYSTSGTTFAHHAVKPNLAGYFWNKGRDVWILDIRTSSGMPTARHPWKFEDVAYADIPAAFNYIYRQVNGNTDGAPRKLDVLAHCMGAAMLSMAILKAPEKGAPFALEREALQRRIGKVVLSQVGPVVAFTPDNILRSYLMRYVRQLLPRLNYEFHPASETSFADQLIDRLLATIPYPEEEFELENPPVWKAFRHTPFTGIRHRMDALYGQDFRLANISRRTLRYIDDLFGPLSLETVSQAMDFARFQTITTRNGINEFVSRENIRERWTFPTLSVHGTENGLADIATLDRMRRVFADAGRPIEIFPVQGYGHQDCLIGKNAGKDVFERIDCFLQQADEDRGMQRQDQPQPPAAWSVHVPWIGPIVAPLPDAPGLLKISATTHPMLGCATHVAYAPVSRSDRPAASAMQIHLERLSADDVRDGWYRGTIDALRWQGITGELLMLFVYPQPAMLGTAEHNKHLKPMIAEQEVGESGNDLIAALLGETGQSLSPPTPAGEPSEPCSEEQRVAIADAIERYLAANPAPELAKGLIVLPHPAPQMRFPTASGGDIVFAVASCQYPAGMADDRTAFASFQRLAHLLEQQDATAKPRFLLLLGDQIYADATAGLFDPVGADDRFSLRYEDLLRHPAVRSVFRRVPVYAMLDDHEIDDNWEPRPGDRVGRRLMKDGREAYLRFLRSIGPAREKRFMDSTFPLWYTFAESGFPFFMLDTRTERMARTPENIEQARIMSVGQFTRLKDWLDEHGRSDLPKFIASPSILLPRLRRAHQAGHPAGALRSDAWDGYPASLHALLAYIADNDFRNVVFLSGDEHLSCHARASIVRPDGRMVEIHSIHSSALYAPFPFANTTPADLRGEEEFCFSQGAAGSDAVGQSYSCTVTTDYALAGDGFAVIRAWKDDSGWRVSCDWNRGHNPD